MRAHRLAWLVLLPLAGCFATPPEGIAQPVVESSPRPTVTVGNHLDTTTAQRASDYAGVSDEFVGGFCAGTSVEGTCVADFFRPIDGCFAPKGSCVTEADGTSYTNTCWDDGSKAIWGTQTWQWSNGKGVSCLEANMVFSSQDGEWIWNFTRGNTVLSYEWQNGAVTCPDDSHITIDRDCPAILAYMKPGIQACTAGACK
jgi:hypothetical protein